MKINKITTVVCAILTILSGVGIILIERFVPNDVDTTLGQGIISGIFTGFIVSLVVALIGYFHEREVCLEKIDTNLRGLYVNMVVMSKLLGKVSSNIFATQDLEQLPFKNVAELSKLNVEFFEKMNLGLFIPFFRNKRLDNIRKKLEQYQNVLFNIKNLSNEMLLDVLQYKIQEQKMVLEQAPNGNVDANALQGLAMKKNAINVRAAKLHEYTTGQMLELEAVAEQFYGYNRKPKKKTWDEMKASLLAQAEYLAR